MSGTSGWLADRVASLVPKTVTGLLPQATAGACVPYSPWQEHRTHCTQTQCCQSSRTCHQSCHGKTFCGTWFKVYCS